MSYQKKIIIIQINNNMPSPFADYSNQKRISGDIKIHMACLKKVIWNVVSEEDQLDVLHV